MRLATFFIQIKNLPEPSSISVFVSDEEMAFVSLMVEAPAIGEELIFNRVPLHMLEAISFRRRLASKIQSKDVLRMALEEPKEPDALLSWRGEDLVLIVSTSQTGAVPLLIDPEKLIAGLIHLRTEATRHRKTNRVQDSTGCSIAFECSEEPGTMRATFSQGGKNHVAVLSVENLIALAKGQERVETESFDNSSAGYEFPARLAFYKDMERIKVKVIRVPDEGTESIFSHAECVCAIEHVSIYSK